MKLPDTNVLLYAVNAEAPQHAVAHDWLRDAFASPAGVGLAWVALLGFLRFSHAPPHPDHAAQVEEALLSIVRSGSHRRACVLTPARPTACRIARPAC